MDDYFFFQSSGLRAAYWRIRACRGRSACLRNWYRHAAKEKARLAGLGYSPEVLRLYGLLLRNPSLERRRNRFEEAFDEWRYGPRQLTLF